MECEWWRDVTGCLDERRLNVTLYGPTVDMHSQYLPSFCRTDILLPHPPMAFCRPEFHRCSSIDLNSWQANGHVAEIHLYFLPKYSLFAPVCVSYLLPVGATFRHVCWCAVGEHVVPSIIDGQGQRARRRRSTQPECNKAARSDRATHNTSSLSFSFDTHVTLESCQETEVKVKKHELRSSCCQEEYIYF